jgi:hypothetical protein
LRRALAAIAGRLVATRAWERLGFARLRDYATERVGLSARQLLELARVNAALVELPGIEAALTAGRISWTAARLLCRVARREDEALWLAAAERMSAQALAREVRAVDSRALENGGAEPAIEDDDDAWPRETVRLRCSPHVRAKWFHARQLARRMAGENLPPWACAEAVAAEVLSAISLETEAEEEADGRSGNTANTLESVATPPAESADATPSGPAGATPLATGSTGLRERPPSPAVCALAPPPPPASFLEPLVAGLESADAFELDTRLRRAVRLEQRHLAQIGPLLLTVASERLFRDLGYRGLDDYARQELGMAASKARALLRLERVALLSPVFRDAWRSGRISWTQAHALAPLLVLEHSHPWHAAWIEHARQFTVRRLEDDVDCAIASDQLDPAALPPLPTDLQTGAYPRAPGEPVRLFFTAPRDVARLFRAVLATVQRRIERDCGWPSSENEALDAMLEHALEAWGRDRPLPRQYQVFSRDGWRCTVPGCTAYRNLQDHHIEFRSAGGANDLGNRTTLCAWHHLRGVHAGVIRCAGQAPAGLRFALGLRDGHPPLMAYTSGDRMRAA